MPTGILAVWSDVDAAGEDDYNAWYDREHLFERLEVPGFHRGRHYLTVLGSPRYFLRHFVTDNAAVVASQAYLVQANQPSPWTRRILPHFRNTNRTACNVVYRIGRGYGAASLTIRLARAVAGRQDELIGWLSDTQLPALVEQPGLIGAQLGAPTTVRLWCRLRIVVCAPSRIRWQIWRFRRRHPGRSPAGRSPWPPVLG